jgi:hypothetical protein
MNKVDDHLLVIGSERVEGEFCGGCHADGLRLSLPSNRFLTTLFLATPKRENIWDKIKLIGHSEALMSCSEYGSLVKESRKLLLLAGFG